MSHIFWFFISSGLFWSYLLVWFNDELLLIVSFLLFCLMVNQLIGVDFVEFIASRNAQVQQHVFVVSKQYILRDLRQQKENNKAAVLVAAQVVKVFLMQSVTEVLRLDNYIQINKLQAAAASVKNMINGEQTYVEGLSTVAFSSVQGCLEDELGLYRNVVLTDNIFRINSGVNNGFIPAHHVLVSMLCSKLK